MRSMGPVLLLHTVPLRQNSDCIDSTMVLLVHVLHLIHSKVIFGLTISVCSFYCSDSVAPLLALREANSVLWNTIPGDSLETSGILVVVQAS